MKALRQRGASLVFGFSLPWKALQLILRDPRLLFLSLFPIALTLSLEVLVILKLQSAADRWLGSQLQGWGGWVAELLARLLILLAGVLIFSIAAGVASAPFNDFLAERAERRSTPPLSPAGRPGFGARARLIALDLAKSLVAIALEALALLLSWVPVLNIAALVLACLLMSFQFLSYPQTRRGEGLGEGMAFLWRHLYACLGFGASLSVLFAIPLVSALFLPLAVVGGTLLYARARNGEQAGLPRLR